MNLYFRRSNGEQVLIGADLPTKEEVWARINAFLLEHGFKSYYTRTWYEEGYTWFDVGSHTEFFLCDGNFMESQNEEDKANDN